MQKLPNIMARFIDIHVVNVSIPTWMFLGVLLLILIAVVLSIVFYLRRRHVWERFAAKHKLRVHRELGKARVTGILDGRPFELSTGQDSSDAGELGVEEVLVSLGIHGALPPGFIAEKHRPHLDEEEQHQPVVSLETASGSRMDVHGHQDDEIRDYLTESRKHALRDLADLGHGGISGVAEGRVYVEKREILSSMELLEREVEQLRSIAERLDASQQR